MFLLVCLFVMATCILVIFLLRLCFVLVIRLCIFFFKQKTAYDMRISDWSSDVCSSDLRLKEWLSAALIGLGLIFAAALAYQWAKEPKIEQRLYGCTARWDAKTGKCKGDWVPLQARE